MKLLLKFNLVLFFVFAVGFLTTGYVCNRLLQQNVACEKSRLQPRIGKPGLLDVAPASLGNPERFVLLAILGCNLFHPAY